ncbi:MAG: hypothetical protein QXW80_06235 [Candidatus Micrarchaeia archaeon]
MLETTEINPPIVDETPETKDNGLEGSQVLESKLERAKRLKKDRNRR